MAPVDEIVDKEKISTGALNMLRFITVFHKFCKTYPLWFKI